MYELKDNEYRVKLTPIGIAYKCPSCDSGEMIGFGRNTNGVHGFNHKCDSCELELILQKLYPYIEWER